LRPNRLSVALAERRAAGLPVIDLTASNPTECGFVYDQGAILAALGNPASMVYVPEPRGLLTAREAVCAYYAARGDIVSPEDVVLTTSTSEAYLFAFRLLCNAGDEVLVPQPSYPLFDFLAELHDVRLVRYPLIYDHGWQIDFHALRERLTERTRAVIVVHPNNPTGHFCKTREMEELQEICAGRGMAIIADEVFLDYALDGEARRSFVGGGAAGHGPALTFTMSGLSKICGLPQMKAAWMVASGPEAAKREALARLEVIADTFLSMNAPVQHAMAELLRLRGAFQEQLMARVRGNLAELDRQLAARDAGDGGQGSWARLETEGGWYAVVRLPAGRDSGELALALLSEHGVYVHPGHFYELPGERDVVVSLITPPADFAAGTAGLLELPTDGD
jgi:alanine-synthesizing transaminase